MIILSKPYVSDYLIETIKKNNYKVLDNEVAREYFEKDRLTSTKEAIKLVDKELFYSNSENSLEWIEKNAHNSKLYKMIELSKNKALFRKKLQPMYPEYYFKEVPTNELKNINPKELKYPFVLKPSVGFLSFGVYPVKNEDEWNKVIKNLDEDIKKLDGIFPKNVVNMSTFLIEQMIDGEEFALDAYFDENGKATILNIFQHPFFNDKDVSDRAYYTNSQILKKYYLKFKQVLDKIGELGEYKNFPFHLELRANEKEIIPIELNPLRFCGWCITDIAQNAWNINVYETFFNQKQVDWNEILKNSTDDYFYFTIGDLPSIEDKTIIKIDFDKYLKNIENPLVIRKIDYIVNPIFAIIFAKVNKIDEIKRILELDMSQFIK